MNISFNTKNASDYQKFLKAKQLPIVRFQGHCAEFPDEYAELMGIKTKSKKQAVYNPMKGLWDYQADIARLAIQKQKFAVFADCGLGKTLIMLEFARHALKACYGRKILIVSPLMVICQTDAEALNFYGKLLPMIRVESYRLQSWLNGEWGNGFIGITNYEAIRQDLTPGKLGSLILDESSMLKSHYGKWGTKLIELGRGLDYKLCLTGTPAPNDRIEYANHAVFLDTFPTVNSFLARYFVNRGETGNRWELKPHALESFYRELSHWCIFLTNPATYGWKDNCENVPPINVHIHDLDLTDDQRRAVNQTTDRLFIDQLGGIVSRHKLARIAKDKEGLKPTFIRSLVDSWPEESTIIWCKQNEEQDHLATIFPEAANISGNTPVEEREKLINDFKRGVRKVMISKPKILGFGLNLQIATRQIFSSLHDSYEEYYQAVKRSNRYGSCLPLNVHIPVTEVEIPMVENVLRKSKRVQQDTNEQERIFRKHGYFAR